MILDDYGIISLESNICVAEYVMESAQYEIDNGNGEFIAVYEEASASVNKSSDNWFQKLKKKATDFAKYALAKVKMLINRIRLSFMKKKMNKLASKHLNKMLSGYNIAEFDEDSKKFTLSFKGKQYNLTQAIRQYYAYTSPSNFGMPISDLCNSFGKEIIAGLVVNPEYNFKNKNDVLKALEIINYDLGENEYDTSMNRLYQYSPGSAVNYGEYVIKCINAFLSESSRINTIYSSLKSAGNSPDKIRITIMVTFNAVFDELNQFYKLTSFILQSLFAVYRKMTDSELEFARNGADDEIPEPIDDDE